jgi:hypothetical protein
MTEGQQARLEGIYDGKCEKYSNRFAVCIADLRIYDMQHNRLEWPKNHTWVQEAWTLKKLKLKHGDKLAFIATAQSYTKQNGEVGIGFTDPKAIEWEPFTI